MKEPKGLLRLMVALEPSSEEGLVGHGSDSGPASAKRILLSALMAELSEIDDSNFNSSPVGLPKPVQVTSQNSPLKKWSDVRNVGIDVLALQADEFCVLVFIGLLEKAVV